ncbi:MAG TPA: hypothetical protein VED84_02715 [Acidimicrobiales bacterium]|nr:hypothetical protein [Acidimicrobiales bacterium]
MVDGTVLVEDFVPAGRDPAGNVTPWSFKQERYAANAAEFPKPVPPLKLKDPLGRRLAHALAAFSNLAKVEELAPPGNDGLVPPEPRYPDPGAPLAPAGRPNPRKPFAGMLTPFFLRHERYALSDALPDEEWDFPEFGDVVDVVEADAATTPLVAMIAAASPTAMTPRTRLGKTVSRAGAPCEVDTSPICHRPHSPPDSDEPYAQSL